MIRLKSEIERDCQDVFMDEDDFAEKHLVDGHSIPCVIDDEQLKLRQGSNELGVEEGTMLLFTPVFWIKKKKPIGAGMMVDGKTYVVVSWNVNAGMNEIVLSHNG